MRKFYSILKVVFLIATLTALVACGKSNSDAPKVDRNGNHPADWIALHGAEAKAAVTSCSQCHGEDQSGGISKVSCMSATISGLRCHVTSPAENPTGCISCHSAPPNGTVAPNRANAHATHMALSGITCDSCHIGAGSGTANHANVIITVAFPDTFKARTITTTFGYDAATRKCSGISCHGGLSTPKWDSSAAMSCLECHEQGTAFQVPQYNSFYSGQLGASSNLHMIHNSVNIPSTSTRVGCIHCHNASILSTKHFTGLTTPIFEATAATTVGGSGTLINTYVPFTSSVPSGSCTSACHSVLGNNPRYWVSP